MELVKATAYTAAKWWYEMGINVIPIIPNDKKPAAHIIDSSGNNEWGHLFERRVTTNEIDNWWNNGHNQVFNVGLIHGEVSNNFVSIDIDKDSGIFDLIKRELPHLTAGMIEQSGSGNGYHIPVFLEKLPDFGWDEKQEKPRGNKTWKTDLGNVNIRARYCQTVVPPSIHPSGNKYIFLQKRPVLKLKNINELSIWLDKHIKQTAKVEHKKQNYRYNQIKGSNEKTLLDAIKDEWTSLGVANHFCLNANGYQQEKNGEIRVLGNGGLLINPENQDWYIHEAQEGGGPIELWAYCRFGNIASKSDNFRLILLEMALTANIDVAQYYHRGDELLLPPIEKASFFWESNY